MKILMVTDDLFPGGAAKHVVDLSHMLVTRGHRVTVAAGNGTYSSRLNSGIPFHHLPVYDNRNRKTAGGMFRAFILLRRLIRGGNFDIVHSHKRVVNSLISFTRRPATTAHVTSVHNVFYDKRIFTRFGDFTICCSETVRRTMIDSFGCPADRSAAVHYGIEPFEEYPEERKNQIRSQLGIERGKKVISSVALFAPYKDRKNLVRAIDRLRTKPIFRDLVFIIQGYGEEKQEIERMIETLHLNESVMILPHDYPVPSVVNVSEFMILNSRSSEGFPIVILEAASAGKMHIGTDVGGIVEFIESGVTGIVVPPLNPAALSAAIAEMIEYPEEYRRLGKNAQQRYYERYTIGRMIDTIENIYDRVHR